MAKAKKRILIVEDDMGISRILMLKLKASGFSAVLALDGVEGLAMLKKEHYDLILLDLRMPRMDGFAFLEELNKRRDRTPVIVCTVLSQDADIARARALGVVDYLVKVNMPLQTIMDRIERFFTTGNGKNEKR